MALALTIPTEPLEHPSMDYAFLRQEGIRLLERMGGQLWTDFNAHDPGITILEQVCYAITDLAYRSNYDLKDLLTSSGEDAYRSLHSPAGVLTTNPVTLTDLRKLVIDVAGVKNAWVEPVEKSEPGLLYDPSEDTLYLETSSTRPPHREPVPPRGIYHVLIETDGTSGLHPADILPEVHRRLHACRNLGEDFVPPTILPSQGIVVDATIEISAVEDPEQLLAQIYHALANFISPRIRFHTLAEMLEQGKRIDEIMDGPLLLHGFIDNAELERLERKAGLRTSDLIQEIMNVADVVAVNNIKLLKDKQSEAWYMKLDAISAPFLDIDKSLFDSEGSTIRLVRGGIEVRPNATRVAELIKNLQKAGQSKPLPEAQRDIRLPAGQDRKIGQYHSIQHQFPATYGIGAMGLPESAAPQRKAQAKQLKAYLMFFDQLLANYFAQLGNAKELFSFYSPETRTYFSQAIQDAALGLDEIIGSDSAGYAANLQAITEDSTLAADEVAPGELSAPSGRKNRFLNHLLARFAEQFTDYSLLMYAHIEERDLVEDKSAFLRDYHKVSAARGTGFNYTLPSWGTENISGIEKRISRKLGLSSYQKQDLAGAGADAEGGFHIMEHILLRPRQPDKDQWTQTAGGTGWQAAAFLAQPESRDPYSHQLSFIFPKWVKRFSEQGFADLIEKTVQEETPAHIRVHLHWLSRAEMLAFESAQKDCMETAIAGRLWDPGGVRPGGEDNQMLQIKFRDARDRIVEVLGLGKPYPLRDLRLSYPPTVAIKHPTQIQILGGQSGVLYTLCDEDGNPIVEKGARFEVLPEAGQAATQVFLPTPIIQKDITFTILAMRGDLELYLNQVISIKAGIDTRLPVAFQPAEGQVVGANNRLTCAYGDKVRVTISQSQEGISYQIISGPKDSPVTLSDAQRGNKGDITLVSTAGFMEDTSINILAYRTSSRTVSAVLETGLSIQVRPNPALAIEVESSIVDYKTASRLTLLEPQDSAGYRLYKRELTAADYIPEQTADNLAIQTDEGQRVLIRAPQKITDWSAAPPDFVEVGAFKKSGGKLSAGTGNLLEDTLFIIRAAKTENGERLQLDQAVVVLVRPNPAVTVSVVNPVVESGTAGVVTASGTQKGVAYQLRFDSNNKPVNPPGYHLTDRGVDTTRLEVDFVIEDQGKAILLLPTGPITKAATFNVLASKILTGVSAQLTDKATLDISPPQDEGENSPIEDPSS